MDNGALTATCAMVLIVFISLNKISFTSDIEDLHTKLDQILENQAKYTPKSFCEAPEKDLATNLIQPTK